MKSILLLSLIVTSLNVLSYENYQVDCLASSENTMRENLKVESKDHNKIIGTSIKAEIRIKSK